MADSFVDLALEEAAQMLGGTLSGTRRYGWSNKSAGAKFSAFGKSDLWLKTSYSIGKKNNRLWEGEEKSVTIEGVQKPAIITVFEWQRGETLCKTILSELAASQSISDTPLLAENNAVSLSSNWWDELDTSLRALHSIKTDRVACRQDLVSRRVAEFFDPAIDTSIANWSTSHRDLHWGNLAHSPLMIFDWEGWGVAPTSLDYAYLLCFAITNKSMAMKVAQRYRPRLDSSEGRVCILYTLAEMIRMNSLFGDYSLAAGKIDRIASAICKQSNTSILEIIEACS